MMIASKKVIVSHRSGELPGRASYFLCEGCWPLVISTRLCISLWKSWTGCRQS